MSIAIVSDSSKMKQYQPLIKKASEMFEKSLFVPINEVRIESQDNKVIHNKHNIAKFQCVLPLPSHKYLDLFLSLVSALSKTDVYMPYSLGALLRFDKRLVGLSKLRKNGMSTMDIHYAISDKAVSNVISEIEFPALVTIGEKSSLVNDAESLRGMAKLRRPGQGIIIEEPWPEKVIGCWVVKDEVVSSMQIKNEKMKSMGIGTTLQETAVKSIRILGSDYGFLYMTKNDIISFTLSPDLSKIERAANKSISSPLLFHMKTHAKPITKAFWDKIFGR